MASFTRRGFIASSRRVRRRPQGRAGLRAGELSEPADPDDLPLGRRRRHRRDGAHRRLDPREGSRPAGERRQPHRRLGRRRPRGDRRRAAGRLHPRHHHGRDLDDALAGPDRADAAQLHAARADERGSAGRAGLLRQPAQDRQGTRRRHQGGASGQAQGVRHRPGRHLAPRARRLAAGHGPEARPRRLGALERRRAGDAGPRRRRPRHRHLLGARGAGADRGRQGAQPRRHGP